MDAAERRMMAMIPDYPPELDQERWRAWVKEGQQHDAIVRRRAGLALVLLCVVLAASAIIYVLAVPR